MKHLLVIALPLLAAAATAPARHLPPARSAIRRPGLAAPSDTNQVRIGQAAPNIILHDDTGKSVSLTSFKGKVVYLDFWGTWCRPCMREMTEFTPALKKQFEGRDVVFLCVSVGGEEAKWKQVIAEQHLAGPNTVHLHAISSNQARDYAVKGYPSYYLIGRDGRFLQVHTTRPSDGAKTVAAIEAALTQ